MQDLHFKAIQAVLFDIKILGHSALSYTFSLYPVFKGKAAQVTIKLVGPLVIGAHKTALITVGLLAKPNASVSAAVLNHPYPVIETLLGRVDMVLDHDHFTLAYLGFFEVAQVRNFSQQTNVAPVLTVKNSTQFLSVQVWVSVGPIRHA